MTDNSDCPDDDACPEPEDTQPEPPPSSDNIHPAASAKPGEPAPKGNTPLHKHSLQGHAARLEANAVDTKPLLGDFVMHGQATMIYAEANAGKTLTAIALVLDAIEQGRLDPDNLIYVNADDSSKGLAEKVRLLEAVGAHVVAPRYRGFKANQFVDKLKEAIADGSARGTVVIIDTLKKFTNLMDKGRSSEFAQVCREYVLAGGTIIALGHTAKSRNPDGTPRYQGTTDILEDFDAVYVAEPMAGMPGSNERIIRFTRLKSRADSPDVVGYAYSTEAGLRYADKVASVRPAYQEELEGSTLEADLLDEQGVIQVLRGLLVSGLGGVGQDKLVRVASGSGDVSRSQARRVLDKYTGTDPAKHHWSVQKGDRGKRTYTLLNPPPSRGDDSESQNPQLKHIVGLLLLTGARVRELLDAKWENVDVARRSWLIPDSKTGKPRHVPLSTAALAIIETLPRFEGCPWLIPNPETLKPYVAIQHSWERATRVAKLKGLRIHDLRHSAASAMVNAGVDLFAVGKVLGHASYQSTQRYAHLANDTLMAAVEAGASKLA